MRKDLLFAGLFLIILAIVMARFQFKNSQNQIEQGENYKSKKVPVVEEKKVIPSEIIDKNVQLVDGDSKEGKKNDTPNIEVDPVIGENLKNHLLKAFECLQINKKPNFIDGFEPNLSALLSASNSVFGEYIVNVDEWSQTDFKREDGTLNRVRIDTIVDEDGAQRTLSVLSLSSSGTVEIVGPSSELARNPTQDYVDSFFQGGQKTLIEKSSRIVYPDGEELIVVEKNGQIDSLNMTRGDFSVSCSMLTEANSNCQCN